MCCKFVKQFMEATDHARHGLHIKLQRSGAWSRLIATLIACAAMRQPNALLEDIIPVRHTEGLEHGFLVLRTLDGKAIADGQMTQDAHGDRVTMHLIFRFKDGSIYEETTLYSQRGTFRLLSDHLIQKGPSFKQSVDTLIDASTGHVKVRYTPEKGQEKIIAQRLELPPDVANGLLFTLMKDVKPSVPQTTVSIGGDRAKAAARQACDPPPGRGTVHDWKLPS
jgi:hypothetical protein